MYAYAVFALTDIGREIKDFCGGQNFRDPQALRNQSFDSLGLPRLPVPADAQPGRTAVVRDPYARWCGSGGAARRPPIPIIDPTATFDNRPLGARDGQLWCVLASLHAGDHALHHRCHPVTSILGYRPSTDRRAFHFKPEAF